MVVSTDRAGAGAAPGAGKGTDKGRWPSRPRPWLAVAVAETAGVRGVVVSLAEVRRVRHGRDTPPWQDPHLV